MIKEKDENDKLRGNISSLTAKTGRRKVEDRANSRPAESVVPPLRKNDP